MSLFRMKSDSFKISLKDVLKAGFKYDFKLPYENFSIVTVFRSLKTDSNILMTSAFDKCLLLSLANGCYVV